jgi:hypothetical protein
LRTYAFLCYSKIGLAVKGQKRQRAKNHNFGIFGQKNFIFPKIIGFIYFRARFRSRKKLEKTFWMNKNLKISPKEDFSQKKTNFTTSFTKICILI